MLKKKVVVAMSGGVDSSVAAYILMQQGHDIVGATMKLLDDEKTNNAIKDAKEVCNILGIKHYVFDLVEEFKNIVINDFINNYKNGLTPNPCILCNKKFKFGIFYEKAKELGYEYIATGHYAKIENGKLKMAANKDKDQSYFLYGIKKDLLNYIIFPLENYSSKSDIRNIAEKADLPVKSKKDSQEVCFVPNDDYKAFLSANMDKLPSIGNICLKDGTILGHHNGLINYTIGQRKGLNISYKEPLYVTDINKNTNEIIVGNNNDLFKERFIANNINLLTDNLDSEVLVKIRSRSQLKEATVKLIDNNKLEVILKEKERAITKGQSVVIYDKDEICLGGGIIEEIL